MDSFKTDKCKGMGIWFHFSKAISKEPSKTIKRMVKELKWRKMERFMIKYGWMVNSSWNMKIKSKQELWRKDSKTRSVKQWIWHRHLRNFFCPKKYLNCKKIDTQIMVNKKKHQKGKTQICQLYNSIKIWNLKIVLTWKNELNNIPKKI